MLDDLRHVEAVAVIRALVEDPSDLQANLAAAQWLRENHPSPETYMSALRASADTANDGSTDAH